MDLRSDSELIASHATRMLPLASALLGDEYRYQSLPLCVIDAVWSIGVRYTGVQRLVARYCESTNQKRIRDSAELPPTNVQLSIRAFCNWLGQFDATVLAEQIFCNKQRTSTQNGILKAEAVRRFAKALDSFGVEFFQDVPSVAASRAFEAEIASIPGQSSGISLKYFWMLTGSDDFVKPDRMVLRFLEAGLGHRVNLSQAEQVLRQACVHLRTNYPNMTLRLLDHEIWKFQRQRKN